MAVVKAGPRHFTALSTDAKPKMSLTRAPGVAPAAGEPNPGDKLFETDTGRSFTHVGDGNWELTAPVN